ncbi:hypothetical protein [Diaphorobacter sp. LR2014-1]|uniref:hypothetical protein n=1 Tax=unclassified Diaphorobacter TaxID=2649760 RepID=UPI0032B16F39
MLDAAAPQRMAAVTIQPTLEHDEKRHTLRGPLLTTVLAAAGVDECLTHRKQKPQRTVASA